MPEAPKAALIRIIGQCQQVLMLYDEDITKDGVAYDRSLGPTCLVAPDGAVTIIGDVLLVLAQSGHSCPVP